MTANRCARSRGNWARPRRPPRTSKCGDPTPAFYSLLRGQTRERLLVQAAKGVDMQAYLRAWLAQ